MEENIIKKKKKWYKRKLFYVLVVVGLLVVSIVYGQIKKANQPPEYETTKVERGTLTQTVDATGNVESAGELELRFETSGRVGKIYKLNNEEVKEGDILVDLQLNSLNAQIAQASASVAKAKANLDKELAGNTTEYLNNMKAKVDQAKANYEQTVANYADQISDSEAAVDTAKTNLDLAEGGEDSQIVENVYQDMVALLQSVQNVMAEGLTEADNILGIDNTLANDEFESVLSALNPSKYSTAKTKYYAAKNAKNDVDTHVNDVTFDWNHEKIDWAGDTSQESMLIMKDMLFAVAEVLNATSPIGDLSQSELDTLKTGIQTVRTTVTTKYSALVDQIQAITTAKNSYTNYKIAYNKAETNLENLERKAEADIAAYQALVDQAQANYEDAKNPPREVDVASYRAALREAQASLSQAVANRNKGRITAPVDGVIGKIDAKVGEYVGATDVVVKLISPHFEIKVDIPETDIIKVSLGDEAEIKLDAYGEDVHFMGKITEIEIGETIIQDVVYYSVTVSLDQEENNGYEVLNGMTADVVFNTEEKENVLYVPQRAVLSTNGDRYVRILKDGELEEINVKMGLRGDGGLVEILEGVSEGDEVVLKVVEASR